MVYLNGKLVDDQEIEPRKHKFIGMFRTPWGTIRKNINASLMNYPNGNVMLLCGCGSSLWSVQDHYEHWLKGHCDIPQFVDIGAENGREGSNESLQHS